MAREPDSVFVYGTLMPAHLRWSSLAPHATGWQAATVPGRLYDTGRGWPAAVFDDPDAAGVVPGVVVDIDPAVLPALLGSLDELEGVPVLFRRVSVRPDSGGRAWAWTWAGAVVGLTPIHRWSGAGER